MGQHQVKAEPIVTLTIKITRATGEIEEITVPSTASNIEEVELYLLAQQQTTEEFNHG